MNAPRPPFELKPSSIHSTGAFATADIPVGALIVEYVGERISKEESLRRCELDNHFIFDLDENWDIDGDVEWNPARFLNHNCSPNSEAQWTEGKIWIVALRPIRAGEELTFNYCYDLEDYRQHPCRCGSAECVGFIVAEEFFDHVRAQRELAPVFPLPHSGSAAGAFGSRAEDAGVQPSGCSESGSG